MLFISPKKMRLLGFIAIMWGVTLLLSACGGQASKVYDVAIHISSSSQQAKVDGFKQGMKNLGYTEGVNIRYYEFTYAGALPGTDASAKPQFEAFAAKEYSAFWATNQTAARTLKPLLKNRPLVVAGMSDPVGGGLVQSLNAPGNSITGLDSFEYELEVDKLRWITKIDSSVKSVYLLYFTSLPNVEKYLNLVRTEAAKLNVTLVEKPLDESRNTERDPAVLIPKLNAKEAQAMMFIGNATLTSIGDALKPAIEREKFIVAGGVPEHLKFGAMFVYSPSLFELGRQSAGFMSKILSGTSPSTLPIAPPDKLDLVLNQKLADQFGKQFPASVIAAADDVAK